MPWRSSPGSRTEDRPGSPSNPSLHPPMQIDPTNPVVALCAEGIQAEARHDFGAARRLFQQAWETHRTDYEAAIAAHYVARHQPSREETLRWNERALSHALRVPEERTRGFFASLYLNLAHSHEMLDQREAALRCLEQGEEALDDLPGSAYADGVRDGLARMRLRLTSHVRR